MALKQSFQALWLAETIRLIEQTDSFADSQANRQAKSAQDTLSGRILARAQAIGQQTGLATTLQYYIKTLYAVFAFLFFCAIFIGAGMAFTALSQQPINLFWALISLLGLHLLTLVIWFFSFLFLPKEAGSLFVQLWLGLTKRLTRKQANQHFIPALISLCGTHIRWGIGFVVNFLWTIILLSALIVLILLFSWKYYSFVWQTTLLSNDDIVSITQNLGTIPSRFGFSIPDVTMIRQSGIIAMTENHIRASWAIWLLGVFFVYGFCVRFILMLFCGINWYRYKQALQLNLDLPEYQSLATRLMPRYSEAEVVDPDKVGQPDLISEKHKNGIGHYLIAIDIAPDWHYPNQDNVCFLGFINDRQQRITILDFLQVKPAQKLLIAIDSQRAPDRGFLHLIMELAAQSQQTAIWLINEGKQYQNWCECLHSLSMISVQLDWLLECQHHE
jgi:hypothetical protein